MEYAIKVENLTKKYIIRHGDSTSSIKEMLDESTQFIAGKIRGLFNGQSQTEPYPPNIEEFLALDNVSFKIPMGAKLGILGRNGAGKSTLLKILCRITEPTSGKVYINGKVSSLLEVGTGFHNELSGRENVFLNGAILGMRRSEIIRKFDEIVAFSEIEKFIDTPVKRYSSGMQVRLAFAVAAHLNPEILILDEVLAVGDMIFQKKCLQKMEEISNSGATVIFVNHGVNAIKQYCNRALVLEHGQISLETTNIDDAIAKYLEESPGT